jgi:bifunctional non-homologous end joining protein LigD
MPASGLRSRSRKTPSGLKGARKAEFPTFIEPCDPSLRQRAPTGDDWAYEIKADGYRAQIHIREGRVTVYSRTGLNWTSKFGFIADAAKRLKVAQAVFDGEAVVYGSTGIPDFQALRRELGSNRGRLRYHAFDLMHLDGYDLRRLAYQERKELLKQVLAGAPEQLIYVGCVQDQGGRVFQHACNMGLEGVIGKRLQSVYRSGRVDDWVKLKCTKSDNFPIVAFVEKLGAHPRRIASLYLGQRKQGRLVYAGKARTGYSEAVARELREQLDPLITNTSPLAEPVNKPKATWVEPALDAEIEYGGLTDDGLLREAVFKGIRDDLRTVPSPSIQPSARPGKSVHVGVPRENILQLLPDAVAPSKEELVRYWRKVGKRALHYLGGRPLKLVRHTHRTTFYHKGKLPPIPESVHQLRIAKREGGEGVRVWVDDIDGLIGLVAMGAVELHPWAATVDDIERADRLVFDLDPGPGVAWDFVVETACSLKRILENEGHESWPKLTGGKGLHVMAPIEQRLAHDKARVYCRSLVERVAAAKPNAYTLSALPARRNNRIFLDYLRNGRGTTAVGAYSPRAREGFPVAAPVTWKDIERGIRPDAYTLTRPPRRR